MLYLFFSCSFLLSSSGMYSIKILYRRCRSLDCKAFASLCQACDLELHKFKPFHYREVFFKGMFQPVQPTTYIDTHSDSTFRHSERKPHTVYYSLFGPECIIFNRHLLHRCFVSNNYNTYKDQHCFITTEYHHEIFHFLIYRRISQLCFEHLRVVRNRHGPTTTTFMHSYHNEWFVECSY